LELGLQLGLRRDAVLEAVTQHGDEKEHEPEHDDLAQSPGGSVPSFAQSEAVTYAPPAARATAMPAQVGRSRA
jgi:hypothetical protein